MSSLDVTNRPNLIIGCGYLGKRVAARWVQSGVRVAALTRRNAQALAATGIEPITGDVLAPATLRGLPAADTVLYAVGMDRTAGKSMREVYVSGLSHVLDALPGCRRFIYVSSTGVYGQTDGGWVDEDSPTEPVEESGKVVLEAERLLRERRPDAIILRFAGMYGPDRLPRRVPVLKGEPLIGDADKWLNLIHIDDGVEAVLAAGNRLGNPTLNITDDAPVTRRAFYSLLAELLHAPPAKFYHRPEPGTANRRVSSRKAHEVLGWAPRYGSCNIGLPAAVAASTPD
jgi:nucleoside-diphosphate-sugar epimerase